MVSDSIIKSNQAAGSGGGLYAHNNDNSPLYGGISVVNTLIHANTSTDHGGGVFIDSYGHGDVITMAAVEVASNHSGYGGGIAIREEHPNAWRTRISVTDNSYIADNSAIHDGGGLYVHGARSVTIEDTVIDDNIALDDGGGLFASWTAEETTLVNSQITGNQAMRGGGAYLASTTYCQGTTDVLAGIYDNQLPAFPNAAGEDVYIDALGSLQADTCDMAGVDSVDGVVYATGDHAYGNDATFSCDAAGCTPP